MSARPLGRDRSIASRSTTYIARCVHGLESFAADEIADGGGRLRQISKRTIVFEADHQRIDTAPPRLVDDIYVLVTQSHDPGRSRHDLARMVQRLDLSSHAVGIDRWSCHPSDVSVTASFVGRRTFTRFDIEDAIGGLLTRHGDRRYWSRRDGGRPPEGTEEWRVILDGQQTVVGVRLGDRPLHRRPWRLATVPGSLHPPVAAAMVRMAHITPGDSTLDPCCGAGTVVIEGHSAHPDERWIGADIDHGAVQATRTNAAASRSSIETVVTDSVRLPFSDGAVDRVVTNPPWNLQVNAHGSVRRMIDEWRRVLSSDGVMVVLVGPSQRGIFEHQRSVRTVAEVPLSVAGQHPILIVADLEDP